MTAAPGRRGRTLLVLAGVVVLIAVSTPVRTGFAAALGTATGGNSALCAVVGFVVGAAPLFTFAAVMALVTTRYRGQDRFPPGTTAAMLSSVGLPLLLSPYDGRYAGEDSAARRAMEEQAPGYLQGHLAGLGTVLGLLALFGVVVGVFLWRDFQRKHGASQDS